MLESSTNGAAAAAEAASATSQEGRHDVAGMAFGTGGRTAPERVADPELVDQAKCRSLTAQYKARILVERVAYTRPGEVGEPLRREGLHTSHLTYWREHSATTTRCGSSRSRCGAFRRRCRRDRYSRSQRTWSCDLGASWRSNCRGCIVYTTAVMACAEVRAFGHPGKGRLALAIFEVITPAYGQLAPADPSVCGLSTSAHYPTCALM